MEKLRKEVGTGVRGLGALDGLLELAHPVLTEGLKQREACSVLQPLPWQSPMLVVVMSLEKSRVGSTGCSV